MSDRITATLLLRKEAKDPFRFVGFLKINRHHTDLKISL